MAAKNDAKKSATKGGSQITKKSKVMSSVLSSKAKQLPHGN